MRKLLSLILAWSLVLALCLPVSAATTGKLVTVTKDNFAAYQTDDEVVMMAWDDLGTVALSAKYLNDPETIYQWIGTAEEIPASLTGQKLAAAFSVTDVARLQATEVFEVEMQNAESDVRGGSPVVIQMIEEELIDLYGTPMSNWPVSVDRTTYAPLTVKVLETDVVDVAYDYNVEFQIGDTLLTVAMAIVSPVTAVDEAISLVSDLWSGFELTYELTHGGIVQTYTGCYLTQRKGFVTPTQGNDVYTHTVTKSIRYTFAMRNIDGDIVLARSNSSGFVYVPSMQDYQTGAMIEEAYRLYSFM